jgi:hypothetical protein
MTSDTLAPPTARALRAWPIVFAVIGVAAVAVGAWGVVRAFVAWWPCIEGRDQVCLDLQYVANPLWDPIQPIWIGACLVMVPLAISTFVVKSTPTIRTIAAIAMLWVLGLNVIFDYVITVGESADSGPGFGVPMMLGVVLAGLTLLVGAWWIRRKAAVGTTVVE